MDCARRWKISHSRLASGRLSGWPESAGCVSSGRASSRAPITATFYSLSLSRLGAVTDLSTVLASAIDRQRVTFRSGGASSMPEPSAALLFAVGFLIVHRALRR